MSASSLDQTSWRAGKLSSSKAWPQLLTWSRSLMKKGQEQTPTYLFSPWGTTVCVRCLLGRSHSLAHLLLQIKGTVTIATFASSQTFGRINTKGLQITLKKICFFNRRYPDTDTIISDFKIAWNLLSTLWNYPHGFLLFAYESIHSFIFQPWTRRHKEYMFKVRSYMICYDQKGQLVNTTITFNFPI